MSEETELEAHNLPTFEDGTLDEQCFNSNWKDVRQTKEMDMQTDPISQREKATQAKMFMSREVQTVDTSTEYRTITDDSANLAKFLREVKPLFEAALEKNSRSHAFDGYDVTWEAEIGNISCILELTPSDDFSPLTNGMSATSCSWNASGSVVAVSYGRFDHTSWCEHTGTVATWNVLRKKIVPNKPDFSLEVSNCLMCVEFHPNEPSILAGGTFNGQIIIWDLTKSDEPVIAESPLNEDGHIEAISRIVWFKDSNRKQSNFYSIGGDGKVLLWSLTQKLDMAWKLEISQGFLLSLRTKLRGGIVTGGTAISINQEDRNTFIVGTEPGRLYRCVCNVDKQKDSNNTDKISFSNPTSFTYEPHTGPVNFVDCSPFHRNLFLSAGCDTQIRIYNMLKQRPMNVLVPTSSYIFCSSWSPYRPMVFAAGCGDGKVFFFDLMKNKTKPSAVLEAGFHKSPVHCIAFNKKNREYFATGDSRGIVKIWILNQHLTQEKTHERTALANVAGQQQGKETKEEKEEDQ